jgi:hypothetical protein
MDAVNRGLTRFFDLVLAPLEALGPEVALLVVSALFGVLALLVFKHISYQKGIRAAKDKIKGHMIAIRIWQDDPRIVGRSIGGVLLRNLQYLGYNLLPFVPLAIPFVFVLAQFVVRYAYAPLPVRTPQARQLAGAGPTLEVRLRPGHEAEIAGLELRWPDFLAPTGERPVRSPGAGRAFQEFVATGPGRGEIELLLADGTRATKEVVAGEAEARTLQPERASGWARVLWPAEDGFSSDSPFAEVRFAYPDAPLRFLPDGIAGVLLGFLVASIVAALAVMKPLRVEI